MTIYSLYIKTHKKTGLKYLGQTKKDPFVYKGSGIDWKTHLKQFGKDIHTEVILQTSDKKHMSNMGRYYSRLWNVVTGSDDFGNKTWANKIPETGGGGGATEHSRRELRKAHAARKLNGTHATQQSWTCEHCGTVGVNLLNYHNSHGDRCSINPNLSAETISKKTNTSKKLAKSQRVAQRQAVKDGTHNTQKQWTCKHCGKEGKGTTNYSKYHGDRCLKNPNITDEHLRLRQEEKNNNPMKRSSVSEKFIDPVVYRWQNTTSREIIHLTRRDLSYHINAPRSNITDLVFGRRRTVRGWTLLQ